MRRGMQIRLEQYFDKHDIIGRKHTHKLEFQVYGRKLSLSACEYLIMRYLCDLPTPVRVSPICTELWESVSHSQIQDVRFQGLCDCL